MENRLVTIKSSATLTENSDTSSTSSTILIWREEHEDILRKWKARCFVNLWLCVASGYFYTVLHNWLSYPVIIMSSVSSAALFSFGAQKVKMVLGVVTLACGIVTCIIRHLKPGEMYQNHSSIAKRYLNLIRTIDTCLSLTYNMRPAPDIFIDRIGNEIDMLETSQIDPPVMILKRFEQRYGAIHRVLYGDDIVELMKIEMEASKLVNKLKSVSTPSQARLSDISSSDMQNSQKSKEEGSLFGLDDDINIDIAKYGREILSSYNKQVSKACKSGPLH